MCSNTWDIQFLQIKTHTHLIMENPLLFPHLSYVCMVCRRARVKASNLAYYGNWGRSKSCTLTGCCRSWLLPQTPKPLTINTTFLNYVVLPLVFWWPTWLYNYYIYAAGIMYSIVVLRSLVNFFLNYKWNDSFPSYLKVKVTEYLLHDNLIENLY